VLARGEILLHTQYNDSCPGIVLEAMASGIPVVYSDSGGTPELVGSDAGLGVPTESSWERVQPPDPDALAVAALAVADEWRRRSEAARARAVDHFDQRQWLRRHAALFDELLANA
jgi:glycosyltransferase involved in cell wall biosynthesis